MTAPFDIVPADADWISVTRRPYGIARVRAHRAGDALMVQAHGGGSSPRPGDWGTVAADGVYGMKFGGGYAFTATFRGAETVSHLQTHQNNGVMAVHGFHRLIGDAGYRDYFTREFYVPAGPGEATPPPGPAPRLRSGGNDPGGLLGTWTILDPKNMHVSAVECAEGQDGGILVRARGADGADWGAVPGHLYADSADPDAPPSFLATFQLGDRQVLFQGRYYLGVLVGAQYVRFTDGSAASDFWTRDAFQPDRR